MSAEHDTRVNEVLQVLTNIHHAAVKQRRDTVQRDPLRCARSELEKLEAQQRHWEETADARMNIVEGDVTIPGLNAEILLLKQRTQFEHRIIRGLHEDVVFLKPRPHEFKLIAPFLQHPVDGVIISDCERHPLLAVVGETHTLRLPTV